MVAGGACPLSSWKCRQLSKIDAPARLEGHPIEDMESPVEGMVVDWDKFFAARLVLIFGKKRPAYPLGIITRP